MDMSKLCGRIPPDSSQPDSKYRLTKRQRLLLIAVCLVGTGFMSLNVKLYGLGSLAINGTVSHACRTPEPLVAMLKSPPASCSFIRQYVIGNCGKRVTVCAHMGRLRVEVRQFIRHRPTIKGVILSYEEYDSLSGQWNRIVDDIRTALNWTESYTDTKSGYGHVQACA